jgi:hypothetical protein
MSSARRSRGGAGRIRATVGRSILDEEINHGGMGAGDGIEKGRAALWGRGLRVAPRREEGGGGMRVTN